MNAIAPGAEDDLPKPFNLILLHARLEASLERKRLRDQDQALHDELERNYASLRELERLRGDRTHMMFHNLRQPMTGFRDSLGLIGETGPLNLEQTECVRLSISNGETLIRMVNNLLDTGQT